MAKRQKDNCDVALQPKHSFNVCRIELLTNVHIIKYEGFFHYLIGSYFFSIFLIT